MSDRSFHAKACACDECYDFAVAEFDRRNGIGGPGSDRWERRFLATQGLRGALVNLWRQVWR